MNEGWSAGSKQDRWSKKQKANGLCPACGRKPNPGKITCERCLEKRREKYHTKS